MYTYSTRFIISTTTTTTKCYLSCARIFSTIVCKSKTWICINFAIQISAPHQAKAFKKNFHFATSHLAESRRSSRAFFPSFCSFATLISPRCRINWCALFLLHSSRHNGLRSEWNDLPLAILFLLSWHIFFFHHSLKSSATVAAHRCEYIRVKANFLFCERSRLCEVCLYTLRGVTYIISQYGRCERTTYAYFLGTKEQLKN